MTPAGPEAATTLRSLAESQPKLAENPADADANLALGKFHALTRGDWPQALPRLALGSDPQLRKLADLALWEPKFFGVKPHLVIKGGQIAYAQMGDANASIPTPQPVLPRPMFGATGRAPTPRERITAIFQ